MGQASITSRFFGLVGVLLGLGVSGTVTLLVAAIIAYGFLRPVAPPRDLPPEGIRVTLHGVYADMSEMRCTGFSVLVAGGKGAQREAVVLRTDDIRRPGWTEGRFFFRDYGHLTALAADRDLRIWGGSSEGSVSSLTPGSKTSDPHQQSKDGIVAFVDSANLGLLSLTPHAVMNGTDLWPLPEGRAAHAAIVVGNQLVVGGQDGLLASAMLPEMTDWAPIPWGYTGAWTDPDVDALLSEPDGLIVVARNGVYRIDLAGHAAPARILAFENRFQPLAAITRAGFIWVAGKTARDALVVTNDPKGPEYRNGPGYLNRQKPDCPGLKDADHCPTHEARDLCALPDGRIAVLDWSSHDSTAIVLFDPQEP